MFWRYICAAVLEMYASALVLLHAFSSRSVFLCLFLDDAFDVCAHVIHDFIVRYAGPVIANGCLNLAG